MLTLIYNYLQDFMCIFTRCEPDDHSRYLQRYFTGIYKLRAYLQSVVHYDSRLSVIALVHISTILYSQKELTTSEPDN